MRVAYAFFCEDLRTEVTGQISAVGLWGRQCNLTAIPGALRSLAFHAFVEHDGEPGNFRIAISLPGVPPLPEVAGTMVPDAGTVGQNFNIVLGSVLIAEPGEVRVRFQLDGAEPIDHTYVLSVAVGARVTEPPAAALATGSQH